MSEILLIKDICKQFGNVQVLKNINMTIDKSKVHALLGANGAGKSTLIKIIGGIIGKTSGDIVFNGQNFSVSGPLEAHKKGISIIHQELSIISQLNVLENFFLGREIVKNGFINRKAMIKKYEEVCSDMDFYIPWNSKAKYISLAKQQMVEIMKAVSCESELIIMDEPTTSLTDYEKQNLFKIIKNLKSKNKTIIYISHMLDEIFTVCDRATIMFGGENAGTFDIKDLTKNKIASLMAGKSVLKGTKKYSNIDYKKEPLFKAENIFRKGKFKNISFSLYKGEVLGIAGLVGSGRSELVRSIFGADRSSGGNIYLNGKRIKISSPKDAIRLGIGLVPEDRKTEALILKHEVYKNSTILSLDSMKKNNLLNKKKEIEYTKKAVDKLQIKIASCEQKVQSLSGGNQQKIAVSKWIFKDMNVIILDEPTRGIDVNAKEDIFSATHDFAKKGSGVIFISSDLEEIIRVSDRIIVMHNGEVVNTRENNGVSVSDLMHDMLLHNN